MLHSLSVNLFDVVPSSGGRRLYVFVRHARDFEKSCRHYDGGGKDWFALQIGHSLYFAFEEKHSSITCVLVSIHNNNNSIINFK